MNFWSLPQRFIFQNPQARGRGQTPSRDDLEAEPGTPSSTPRQVPPFPETPETLAEQTETKRMRVRGESARARTDVSIEQLGERTRLRNYDPQTPHLIEELRLDESPENQARKLDTLYDVSMMMLAQVLYHHRDASVGSLGNIAQIQTLVEGMNPRPAERAALAKLSEIQAHPDSPVSRQVREQWTRISETAGRLSGYIARAERFDGSKPPQASETWLERNFRKYPKTTVALGLAGAVAGFFAIRGICRWIFGGKKKNERRERPDEEEESGIGTWIKRALWTSAAAFGLGYIIGWDRMVGWGKKLWGKTQEAWATVFGQDPEIRLNNAMYERMAHAVSKEMAVPITKDTLADLGEEKYKDFVADGNLLSRAVESVQEGLGGLAADILPGAIGRWVYDPEKRKQARAVRAYLKSMDRQRTISQMRLTDDTTLAQVMNFLDERLNGQQRQEQPSPSREGTPEVTPAITANELLPYLKENYGEVSAENFQKIGTLPYRGFMTAVAARGFFQEFQMRAREAGAEAGIIRPPTAEERVLLRSENFVRRFLRDHERVTASLTIPNDATVGTVLTEIVRSRRTLQPNEVVVAASQTTVTNNDIEGIQERDETARRLPEQKKRLYLAQRKKLTAMLDDDTYVRVNHANTLIQRADEIAQNMEDAAGEIPERNAREAKRREARAFRELGRKLQAKIAMRSRRIEQYRNAISRSASDENIHVAFMKIVEANEEIAKAYNRLEGEIVSQERTRQLVTLTVLQVPRVYRYLNASRQSKEFIRNYWGSFGLSNALIARISDRLKRPTSGIAFTERRIMEAELRLRGELGGASRMGVDSLESRAQLGRSVVEDENKLARVRYEHEAILLEHDKKMLNLEREFEQLKNIQRSGGAMRVADVDRLNELGTQIQDLRLNRVRLEREAIKAASEEFYGRIRPTENTAPKALREGQWRELDDLARRGAEHNRDIMRASEDTVERIQEAVRRGAPQAEIDNITRTFNDQVALIPKNQKRALQKLGDFIERYLGRGTRQVLGGAARATGIAQGIEGTDRATGMVRGVIRERREILIGAEGGTILRKSDKAHFRKVIYNILHWQRAGAKAPRNPKVPLFKVAGRKLLFYSLTIGAISGAVGLATRDKKTGIGAATAQAAFEIAPLTGTYSDFYTMATGRERFGGRKVSRVERWLFRPVFGLVGAASDLAILAGGIGLWGRAGLGTLKAALAGTKAFRSTRAVGRAAETATEAIARAGAREAGEAAARAAGQEAAQTVARASGRQRLQAAIRKIGIAGTVATVGLGLGGLGLSLVQTDEVEIPPAIQKIGGVEDINLEDLAAATTESDE